MIHTTQTKESTSDHQRIEASMILNSLTHGILRCPPEQSLKDFVADLRLRWEDYGKTWIIYRSRRDYRDSLEEI